MNDLSQSYKNQPVALFNKQQKANFKEYKQYKKLRKNLVRYAQYLKQIKKLSKQNKPVPSYIIEQVNKLTKNPFK